MCRHCIGSGRRWCAPGRIEHWRHGCSAPSCRGAAQPLFQCYERPKEAAAHHPGVRHLGDCAAMAVPPGSLPAALAAGLSELSMLTPVVAVLEALDRLRSTSGFLTVTARSIASPCCVSSAGSCRQLFLVNGLGAGTAAAPPATAPGAPGAVPAMAGATMRLSSMAARSVRSLSAGQGGGGRPGSGGTAPAPATGEVRHMATAGALLRPYYCRMWRQGQADQAPTGGHRSVGGHERGRDWEGAVRRYDSTPQVDDDTSATLRAPERTFGGRSCSSGMGL